MAAVPGGLNPTHSGAEPVHPVDSGRRWVVYSTFDSTGAASEPAVDQVRSYRRAGFEVLVVDTSPAVSLSRQQDWSREATAWLHRENSGYDFGSYKAGLAHLKSERRIELLTCDILLTNDSCFGPFFSLDPIFDRFDGFPRTRPVIFGMTDSVWDLHHIQSYWLYFRSDVSHLLTDFFFGHMRAALDREEAIEYGELSLGRFLAARGCLLEVACPVHSTVAHFANFDGWFASTLELGLRRVAKRWKYNRDADTQCLRHLLRRPEKLRYFNPVILFGVQLYKERSIPFVKKSLLRDNVYKDPAIPAGIDIAQLRNSDVRTLLG